jgi:hypothetical protein
MYDWSYLQFILIKHIFIYIIICKLLYNVIYIYNKCAQILMPQYCWYVHSWPKKLIGACTPLSCIKIQPAINHSFWKILIWQIYQNVWLCLNTSSIYPSKINRHSIIIAVITHFGNQADHAERSPIVSDGYKQ